DHADIVRGYARENGILCANIEQGGIGKGPETFRVLFVLGENLDEFMRLRITRRLKEHCIHQTEDGGIRADAKREHENGSDGEARRFDQLTTRESKIMNHNFSDSMRGEHEMDSTNSPMHQRALSRAKLRTEGSRDAP